MNLHNLYSIIPYKNKFIKMDQAIAARAFYRHHFIDLLSGEKIPFDFSNWILENQKRLLSSLEAEPRVVHLFYELGFLIEKELNLLDEDALLAIDIEFSHIEDMQRILPSKINLLLKSSPELSQYKKDYSIGYNELVKGNCYQFNLTYPYSYSFDPALSPLDFIFALWRKSESVGAFGSATYIPFFEKLFLSNSPECLFQYKKNKLTSMPIKGTLLRNKNDDLKYLWTQLINDKKNQSELFMISDLIRNDLSRIELPRAHIVKKKFPKLVPGLLHQCSQIEVELSNKVSLWQVIQNIFPGGSITGAPKVRAMRILKSLEKRQRGFYCGSTLILYKDMKSASINIRSSEIDFKKGELIYQAGGGITLLSDASEEFLEMTYKHNSFISALTL